MDEILTAFAQFSSEVQRFEAIKKAPSLSTLRNLWYPVSRKVDRLLEFGRSIELIGKRYSEEEGKLQGEVWAVKLNEIRTQINLKMGIDENTSDPTIPHSTNFDDNTKLLFWIKPGWWSPLCELKNEFNHMAYEQMHRTDKKLRDTANELYILSRAIFGNEQ